MYLPKMAIAKPCDAERAVSGRDVGAEVALRHALLQGRERRLVGFDGDLVGALEERQLGGRLDDAAADDDRVGGDELGGRKLLAQAVEDGEADALLDTDAGAAEGCRHLLVGASGVGNGGRRRRVSRRLPRARPRPASPDCGRIQVPPVVRTPV